MSTPVFTYTLTGVVTSDGRLRLDEDIIVPLGRSMTFGDLFDAVDSRLDVFKKNRSQRLLTEPEVAALRAQREAEANPAPDPGDPDQIPAEA